jgi:signal transduction histidine kinase
VEDHGTGVPEADVPLLFDRFTSSDRSPNSVGLGLWIVHTLVHAHGGTIRYEAAGHGGARFVIELPAAGRTAGTAGIATSRRSALDG